MRSTIGRNILWKRHSAELHIVLLSEKVLKKEFMLTVSKAIAIAFPLQIKNVMLRYCFDNWQQEDVWKFEKIMELLIYYCGDVTLACHRHLLRSEHTEKSTSVYRCAFFSYIRLRRVLLLRSDIRLTPSDIRFASFGGEYNITAERSGAISLLRSKNITLTKSAYH